MQQGMRVRVIVWFRWGLVLVLLALGVEMAGCHAAPAPLPRALAAPPPYATPNPAATVTPFLPLPPTAAWLPTWTPSSTPTPSPTPTLPPPKNLAEAFERRVNILLLGSDQRPWEVGFRTDTIILASYNPETGATSLISFPRDLWLQIPGVGYNRINTAMFYGGFDTLAETMAIHFQVRPKYYILVGHHGFKAIIETLGGIDVYVPTRFCDNYYGRGFKCVGPGTVHMNADEALWYARGRTYSNDLDRNRRQQAVLLAILDAIMSMDGLRRAPELYNLYRQWVDTNIRPGDLPGLLVKFRRFDPRKVKKYTFTAAHVYPWVTPGGAQVLLPNMSAIHEMLMEAATR
ncbi:MAG: LCP family protein [Chloroflexi bacterium]|nr:LCP family protein [Chloroflexota bacterium]